MRRLVCFVCALVFVEAVTTKGSQEEEIVQWILRLKSFATDCPSEQAKSANSQTEIIQTYGHCMRNRALFAIDTLFSDNIIPVVDGVNLIRFKTNDNITEQKKSDELSKSRDNDDASWSDAILSRLARVFKTHVLQIDVDILSKSLFSTNSSSVVEGRKRNRRRNQVLPLLATGLLLMGSVLIPMGFQFLAVLGGKALLLAKMALVLSSIQGLKKIATNGMNYGFYHSPVPPDSWHERSQPELTGFNPPPPYTTFHHHP